MTVALATTAGEADRASEGAGVVGVATDDDDRDDVVDRRPPPPATSLPLRRTRLGLPELSVAWTMAALTLVEGEVEPESKFSSARTASTVVSRTGDGSDTGDSVA